MAMIIFELTSAASLSYDKLSRLINQAYSDYFLPVWLDEEQFAQMCYEEDVDLSMSVVTLAEGDPVGIALLSRRGKRGWVSGVGVLPLWRRRGIARQMLQHLQASARDAGMASLTLEVLGQNHRAVVLYESLDFVWQRDLLVLSMEPNEFALEPLPDAISSVDPMGCLEHYEAFHDTVAPWQRERLTLQHRAPALKGLGFWESEQLLGYLLYDRQPHHHAVYDLAVLPSLPHRLSIAGSLLLASHSLSPHVGGYIINIPIEDPLLPVFTRLHYRIWQRQYEMLWTVAHA